jgi:predicted  nucleic acid-binding Zn-ribbon protein
MIRQSLFVLLLLATGFALADDRPEAQPIAGAAEAQPKTEAAQRQEKHAQAQADKDAKAQADKDAKAQADKDAKAQADKDAKAQTDEEVKAQTDEEAKLISVPGGKALGMSILGNQEAPTSLVIVPWKSSELGGSPGISPMLDDSRQPVDKEVFMRALSYYEIRSETKR